MTSVVRCTHTHGQKDAYTHIEDVVSGFVFKLLHFELVTVSLYSGDTCSPDGQSVLIDPAVARSKTF